MTKTSEATLAERAGYLYRRLLLLQCAFPATDENDPAELTERQGEGQALRMAIREVLEDLAEEARILTKVPHPIRDWRPGDGPDDERWRGLTEIERREVLSLASAHEDLIVWAEGQERRRLDLTDQSEVARTLRKLRPPTSDATDYLDAERARIARFRREMTFLERHRIAESA